MPEENEPREAEGNRPERGRRRRYVTRRNAAFAGGLIAIVGLLVLILTVISYRYGVFDPYVKEQFTAKMADIGIVFDAEVFRVTVAPRELELKNATFKNKVTGEVLFSV